MSLLSLLHRDGLKVIERLDNGFNKASHFVGGELAQPRPTLGGASTNRMKNIAQKVKYSRSGQLPLPVSSITKFDKTVRFYFLGTIGDEILSF